MSVTVKERDRDRQSVVESVRERPRGTVTTVRRYRVPDRVFEDDRREEEVRIVRREREPERREYRYDRDYDEPDIVIRRKEVDQPSAPRVEEWRIEREVEREREPPKRDPPYELERYSRSTEYYARPEPPIIIRQEPQPIIIQEAPRREIILRREEPQYEIIERPEAPDPPKAELQVARREPPKEEEYYYERRVREVDRGPIRDEYYAARDRDYRRDLGSRELASPYGDAYSDDDLVVVRRERADSEYGGRDRSPRRLKHLAEGALAGAGVAALVGHHRSKQGHEEEHTGRNVVGGAALGAVGAAVVTKGKDWWEDRRTRSRSRVGAEIVPRGEDWWEERRIRSRSREWRARSRSVPRIRKLAELGAVAALGALAGYAARGKQESPERRSRSRRRRHSVSGARERSLSKEKHLDPEHRNRRIAQAGLASAAVAGLVERVRSRSRPGRERSRIRTGVPIVATGLGGAALAGLYERNQARKASEERRSRSRSRSVARSERSGGRRGSEPGLIEYGEEPIFLETRGRRHRGSPDSRSSGSPAGYRRRSGSSRSHSRSRHIAEAAAIAGAAGVAAHAAGKRRERKRHQKERKSERKRSEHEEARQEPYDQNYEPRPYDPYPSGVPLGGYPTDRYYPSTNQFPPPPAPTVQYPPPEPIYANSSAYVSAAPYDPGQYAPPPMGHRDLGPDPYAYQSAEGLDVHNGTYYPDGIPPPSGQRRNISPDYSYSPPPRQHQRHEGDRDISNGRGEDDNVSAPSDATTPEYSGAGEGLRTPRQRSPGGVDGTREQGAKSVQFDFNKDKGRPRRRRRKHGDDDGGGDEESGRRRHRREKRERREGESEGATGERRGEGREDERSSNRHSRSKSPASDASGGTVELPPRFNEQGRKIPERGDDRIADNLEDFLNGKGTAGRLFQRFKGDLLGGGSGSRRG